MDAKTESTRACKRSKDAVALSSLTLISASYPFRMCFVASLTRPKSGSDQLFQPQRPSGLNLDTSTKVCLLSTGAAGAQSSSVPSHLLSPQLHPQLTKMVGFPRLSTCFSDKYGKRVLWPWTYAPNPCLNWGSSVEHWAGMAQWGFRCLFVIEMVEDRNSWLRFHKNIAIESQERKQFDLKWKWRPFGKKIFSLFCLHTEIEILRVIKCIK